MADITIHVDEKLKRDWIPFEGRMEALNDETLAAIAEVEELKNHPEKAKYCRSSAEFLKDLDKED